MPSVQPKAATTLARRATREPGGERVEDAGAGRGDDDERGDEEFEAHGEAAVLDGLFAGDTLRRRGRAGNPEMTAAASRWRRRRAWPSP